MNKIILSLAVIGILVSCGGENKKETKDSKEGTSEKGSVIAYYDLEKMYTDLEFSKNANASIQAEGLAVQEKYQKLQQEYQSSMRIINSTTASVDQQIAADRRMQNAQKKMAELEKGELYEFQMKQAQLENELAGYLIKYSEEYAKEHKIDVILVKAPGGNISYINKSFDISDEFVKYVNSKVGSGSQGQMIPPQPPVMEEPQ